MTNIVIHIGPDTMKLSMSGHACYRMDGNDVVCSAVSILGQALADAMFHVPDVWSTAKRKYFLGSSLQKRTAGIH